MKTNLFISIAALFAMMVICRPAFSQSVGQAADKQKQANLEKNKARQAELKKRYNQLTPEQAAEAKKRANEYKNGGYKKGKPGAKPTTGNKPSGSGTVIKPDVNSSKPADKSNTGAKAHQKPKPVFLDKNGKPVSPTKPTTPASNRVEKSPVVKAQPGKK
jgi:hypothetical protein